MSSRFHDKVRKYVRREQQDLPSGQFPCLVTNQAPSAANKKGVSFQVPKEEKLYLRGPEDRLDSLAEKILQFVEAEKRDELERGFTLSFDFPQKFASNLIGKKGDNINKLREEFDVDIQVNDGKVEVKGPKAKAEGAKGRILAMSKKLEDEVTHTIQIEPRYHREMIGAKGSQVTRLEERYNVRVQFPRSRPDDASVNGSEAGGPRSGRAQAANEVIIRGPQRGANEARDELLNLLQWTKDNSHTAVVTVAKDQIPSLIGQGGREMDSIRESTGAKIDVPNSRDAADSNGRVDLKIKGTKQQVEQAQKLLKERSKTFDESISTTIEVDKKYHRDLIGPQGMKDHN